jgi:hypothetical protein
MESPEGFGREIEQLFPLQSGSVETRKNFPDVHSVTFQEFSEAGDEIFALLLVSRFDHHQHLVESHELVGVFLVELYVPLLPRDQIAPSGDKPHRLNGVEGSQHCGGKAEEEYGFRVRGGKISKTVQGPLLTRSQRRCWGRRILHGRLSAVSFSCLRCHDV